MRRPFALPEPCPHLPRHQLRKIHGRRVQAEPPRRRAGRRRAELGAEARAARADLPRHLRPHLLAHLALELFRRFRLGLCAPSHFSRGHRLGGQWWRRSAGSTGSRELSQSVRYATGEVLAAASGAQSWKRKASRPQRTSPRAHLALDAGSRRGLQRRQLPRERRLVSVAGGLGLREVRARALLELRDGFVEASCLHL